MPFRLDELQQRFAQSIEQGRMGHSYLLTGDRAEELENLALGLAAQVLHAAPQEHPDFHSVRAQSKSRRITVEQIRELEHELYLKPYLAPLKVAVIFDAERMCLGSAEPANAFLKTLEEPPAHTLILLTSGRSAMLLPTIISRCLRLDLGFSDAVIQPGLDSEWIQEWFVPHPSAMLRAYARAQVLQNHWANLRTQAEKHLKDSAEPNEDITAAFIEAEFQLGRQESIAQLQRWYWRTPENFPKIEEKERIKAVKALEELQSSLAQNVDANLAVERICFSIEGLI